MALQFLISLFLISLASLYFNKWRRSAIFGLLGLLWGFGAGCGVLPRMLLGGLQNYPHSPELVWKRRNVVVLLGAGTVRWPSEKRTSSTVFGYSRMHEAARLYTRCKTDRPGEYPKEYPKDYLKDSKDNLQVDQRECRVLITGGDPLQNGVSEAEVMKSELGEVGVPARDVILDTKSNNTFQNAQFSSEVLKARGFDQIILVTSGVHGKRSLAYFSRFIDESRLAPSDRMEAKMSVLPLAYNLLLTDFAIHECLGLVKFRIYNALGLNPGSSKPGSV